MVISIIWFALGFLGYMICLMMGEKQIGSPCPDSICVALALLLVPAGPIGIALVLIISWLEKRNSL